MKAKLLFGSLVLVLMAIPAYSQVAGTWMGETQGRGGTQEITLMLDVDDSTLTGTYKQGDQAAAEISDGMVDGDSFSFSRSLETGRGAFNLTYTGEIDGDKLTMTVAFPAGGFGGRGGGGGRGAAMPIVLTRQ